ncbi:hypothetical protein MNBD_PLANCTO03-1920 [hydrothermal vent metagenome]|uniref:Flippase-like domain-containing protein n=1 Tax=hydrothermal vent metagenome TaxID=652676 RepID=A0A3B1DR27_9ZZZZ
MMPRGSLIGRVLRAFRADSGAGKSPLLTGKFPPRPLRRVVGGVIGLGLLVAAVWAVWSQRPVLTEALGSLRDAPAGLVVGAMLLPLVSWLATAATFWLLSNRYARVPMGDMVLLIGAAWLLNYLPFRPGMVGRVAFHRKYHEMAIADSVRVMISAMVLSGISLGMLLAVAVGVSRVELPLVRAACLAGPTVAVGVVAGAARAAGWSWWREVAALCVRSLDMLAWVGRYAIVFALVGQPLALEHVVAVAAVCQVAMVVPLTGNGLGLREWAVGLMLAVVAATGMREQAAAIGLTADLVNRAAELVLVVPVGLWCSWMLARLVKQQGENPAAVMSPSRSGR